MLEFEAKKNGVSGFERRLVQLGIRHIHGKASADRTAGDHMTATWADSFTHCQGCVPWIGSRTSTTMIGRTVLLTGGIRDSYAGILPQDAPYMETVIDQQTGEEC